MRGNALSTGFSLTDVPDWGRPASDRTVDPPQRDLSLPLNDSFGLQFRHGKVTEAEPRDSSDDR